MIAADIAQYETRAYKQKLDILKKELDLFVTQLGYVATVATFMARAHTHTSEESCNAPVTLRCCEPRGPRRAARASAPSRMRWFR